jgi:hypothetical protein
LNIYQAIRKLADGGFVNKEAQNLVLRKLNRDCVESDVYYPDSPEYKVLLDEKDCGAIVCWREYRYRFYFYPHYGTWVIKVDGTIYSAGDNSGGSEL